MKRPAPSLSAFSLVELLISMSVTTLILGALVVGSIALQRSAMGGADYAMNVNDQTRICDYIALDMRRAYSVSTDGTTVTLTIPKMYNADGTKNAPHITQVLGWPASYKKHHHHKHKNEIVGEVVDYGTGTTTQTIKYYRSGSVFIREVDGAQKTIANNVADFSLTVSDIDETSYMQLTFNPLFHSAVTSVATTGTDYFQVALFRNTR